MITKKKLILIIALLSGLLILLMILVSRINKPQPSSNNTPTPGASTPTPDLTGIMRQITIYPTLPNTPVGKLKRLHSAPQIYENITIQYKPRSDTFVIYYQGSESTARQTLTKYLTLNNIFEAINVTYISLDPISVTLPPRGFE